jgi:hypothetical protein
MSARVNEQSQQQGEDKQSKKSYKSRYKNKEATPEPTVSIALYLLPNKKWMQMAYSLVSRTFHISLSKLRPKPMWFRIKIQD